MPEDFGIPFPHRCSPDLPAARTHTIRWLRSHGLLRDELAEKRFTAMALAEVSAYAYPDATGAELDVVTDAVSWIAICDDLLDELDVRDPEALHRAWAFQQQCFASLDAWLAGRPAPGATPLDDLLSRLGTGMTQTWRDRFADGLRRWFWSSVDAAFLRPANAVLSLHTYRVLCRETNGNRFFFPLTERAGGFEAPAALFGHPHFEAVHAAADELVAFVQAVHSMDVEEARGDHHNLVLVLEHQLRCSRAEATTAALAEITAAKDRFLHLTASLPQVYDQLDFTPAPRAAAERYVDGMRDIIAAARDYGTESSRYQVVGR
ncbi:hypothetical protein [Lentzea sp. NPDC059081]|uniref:terpene synthase family protein n=1 Tax=Lentzea sp. NPDC059081 TaxID=3346719 RepID=UPI0036C0808C